MYPQNNHQRETILVSASDYAWVKPALIVLGGLVVLLLAALAVLLSGGSAVRNRVPPQVEVQQSGGSIVVHATPTPGAVPTPEGDVRTYRVGSVITWQRTVSRLETKEYDVVADAVKPKVGGMFNIGSESIQSHLVGTVIGRTDLSGLTLIGDLTEGDITISPDGKQISIVLPYPEISRPIIDESQSSFNGHDIGWFTKSDPNLWQAARIEASSMLVEKACEQGILEKARLEAEAQVKAIFGIGFKEVFVQTRPATRACGK